MVRDRRCSNANRQSHDPYDSRKTVWPVWALFRRDRSALPASGARKACCRVARLHRDGTHRDWCRFCLTLIWLSRSLKPAKDSRCFRGEVNVVEDWQNRWTELGGRSRGLTSSLQVEPAECVLEPVHEPGVVRLTDHLLEPDH